MLFREIIAGHSENHKKPTGTICEHSVALSTVKAGGSYSYHWALKIKSTVRKDQD
jgi:hypothetical protein